MSFVIKEFGSTNLVFFKDYLSFTRLPLGQRIKNVRKSACFSAKNASNDDEVKIVFFFFSFFTLLECGKK